MTSLPVFDYIVVGGGATGCVLANRLSADRDVTVLLLEAGGTADNPDIDDIGGFVRLWGSDADWKFQTEPQAGQSGRQHVINQGRVIGGSTSINALMYVRGNRRNFDHWGAVAGADWSYEAVLPYFKRSEDYQGGSSEYHGVGGPLKVRSNPEAVSRSEAFLVGATELGYDGPDWDYNGARQENGAGPLQFTINEDGKRSSAARAFLDPIRERPNLTIKTGAEVTRLRLDGSRVIGVEYTENDRQQRADVEREVIVSAGAFQSPKILMLSGIGPADHLRAHGLPVIADLPGVGQNLQDHLQLPVVFRAKVDQPMPTLLTGNVLFTRTRAGTDEAPPDLQLNFTPAVPAPLAPVLDLGGPACIFLPILVQPNSIGTVALRSSNPHDPPVIDPNYLHDASDVQVLVEAVKLIRSLTGTKAFADLNGGELVPGPDTDLEAFIRTQTLTIWHPAGTCQMGRDAQAVVDPQLRVRGIDGLRVADASVMPAVTSGNTLAACYMIGERLADMIRQAT